MSTLASDAAHVPPARRGALAAVAGGTLLVPPAISLALAPSVTAGKTLWACPLLHATGVPCPACGATRAFVYLFSGDPGTALRFNWLWVVLWLVLAAISLAALFRLARGRPGVAPRVASAGRWVAASAPRSLGVALGFVLAAWLLALVNLDAIAA